MLLPTPLSWTKKLFSILKSNLSPNQIAFAFSMGLFAGLPPMGWHLLIPFGLVLLIRCSFRAFLISMGLFKLIALAAAPVSYAMGRWLLAPERGLDALWRWLFSLPVLAPMGYSRYLLLGCIALGALMFVPIFMLVRLLVIRYRVSFAEWVSGWRLSGWLRGRRGVMLARRFFVGGEAKYVSKVPPKGPFRYVRREMLVGLPLLYLGIYLIAAAIVPFFADTVVTSTASWVTGTEITADDASFNLLTGALTLSDVSIQDPQKADENLIATPEIRVDVGMIPLVSNRLVLNAVRIADMELHVVREPDGTLNIDNAASGWDAAAYVEWASQHAHDVDWLGLLRTLADYLKHWEPPGLPVREYSAYRGGRSFEPSRAPFAIQRLEIGRVLVRLSDESETSSSGPLPPLTLLEVEFSNLAFPATLRETPTSVTLRGQWGDDSESGFTLSATVDGSGDTASTRIVFAIRRLDLPSLASFYASTLPVRIASGWATITGTLRFEDGEASGTSSFVLEEFQLEGTSKPLFGLPSDTSRHVMEGINTYAAHVPVIFGVEVDGPSQAPHWGWEAPLLEVARQGLAMLGRRELDRTIETLGQRVADLGGIDPSLLDSDLAAIQRSVDETAQALIMDAARGLLDDALPITPPSVEGVDDAADLLPGLLERLLDSKAPNGETESD